MIGRTPGDGAVLKPPAPGTAGKVRVIADGGPSQALAGGITAACLLTSLELILALTARGGLRYPRRR